MLTHKVFITSLHGGGKGVLKKIPKVFGGNLNSSNAIGLYIPWVSEVVNGNACFVHTSTCHHYPGKEWRKRHGKPANPNAYGPLTDGPDYSYLDGRPTPIGSGKLERAKKQLELSNQIIKMSEEVDLAVTYSNEKAQREAARKSQIIKNKLKPKGSIPPDMEP